MNIVGTVFCRPRQVVVTSQEAPASIWSKRFSTSGNGLNGSGRDPREAAAALDAVSECVFVLDREHRLLRVNRAACERLGIDAEDVLGRPCYRLVHGRDDPVEGCPHERLLADGLAHVAEIDEPRLGGRVHVSCSPLTDADGHLAGCAHVVRPLDHPEPATSAVAATAGGDQTAADRDPDEAARTRLTLPLQGAEDEAAVRHLTLDAGPLLDAMPELFAVLDQELRLLWVNEAAAAEAGSPREALLGRPCREVLCGADAVCDGCAVTAAVEARAPARSERRSADGRYFLHHASPVFARDGALLALVALAEDVTARRLAEIAVAESATRTRAALQASVRAMGAVIELRDPDTARHQRNVARLAQALAVEMGLAEEVVESLWYAGQLLDIGKLAVPIDILGRPGVLSETERMLVRVHPRAAERVLQEIPFDLPVARAVAQHHERLDGSGYPDGLAGEQIALEARVLAVADVVTAMVTHRPHRPALTLDDVMTELRRGAGTQFDGDVVAALEQLVERGELPENE